MYEESKEYVPIKENIPYRDESSPQGFEDNLNLNTSKLVRDVSTDLLHDVPKSTFQGLLFTSSALLCRSGSAPTLHNLVQATKFGAVGGATSQVGGNA